MSDVFLITAYCDTEEKKDILRETIQKLKRFNADICISSHYPIDLDIQNSVNYIIYDKSNPVIYDGSKTIIRWRWYVTAYKMLNFTTPDYSYAVINLWKNGLTFLKTQNYDKIYIINYDNYIKTELLFNKCSELLDENDLGILYLSTVNMSYNNIRNILITLIPIKTTIIDDFLSELTFEKYLGCPNAMLEQFFSLSVLPALENKIKIKNVEEQNFINDMNCGSKEQNNQFDTFERYNEDGTDWYAIFVGKNLELGFVEILIYEITRRIDKLEIILDREHHIINNIDNRYCLICTSIKNEELNDVILNNQIEIKVNDKDVISKDDMNLFLKLNSAIFFKNK